MSIDVNNVDLTSKLVAQDILSRLSAQPIYLSRVEVSGGDTFSQEFFGKLLSPIIDKNDLTFNQLINSIDESYQRLRDTGVFKDVSFSLSTDYARGLPEIKNYNDPSDKVIPTKISVNVKPVNLNVGEYSLGLNNVDDPLSVKLNYLNNNVNSNAELIDLGVKYSPYKPYQQLSTNGTLLLNLNNPKFKFLVNAYHNNQVFNSNNLNALGGKIGLNYINRNLFVNFGLGLSKNTYIDTYIKTSIFNELKYGNLSYLDEKTANFPTNGIQFHVQNEFSAIEESQFVKSSVSLNLFKSILNNSLTVNVANNLGIINSQSSLKPIDKFYLGGYESFRGFTRNSINIDGGSQFFKVSSSLFWRLPEFIFKPVNEQNPLRLYANWVVGAVNDNIARGGINSSVGFGVKYFNNWANFDLGYYTVTTSESSSGIKDGFQFSVAIGGSNK